MINWTTAFEVGDWHNYELVILAGAIASMLFWIVLTRWKPMSLLLWSIVCCFCLSLLFLCFSSRYSAMRVAVLLSEAKKIEVVSGRFRYGDYRFPYAAKHNIGYREIHIGKRTIRLYHSGYLPSSHCYRQLYSRNMFSHHTLLRLSIHWVDYHYLYRRQTYQLKIPCILKIEIGQTQPL